MHQAICNYIQVNSGSSVPILYKVEPFCKWNIFYQNTHKARPITELKTHWGRVMHICISKLTIIGSDIGLLLDQRQVIFWTNARILLIGPLGTNFNGILIKILTFSFKKMHLKVASAKWQPFCLCLNVLKCSLWVQSLILVHFPEFCHVMRYHIIIYHVIMRFHCIIFCITVTS